MKTVCNTRLFNHIAIPAIALLATFGSYAQGALSVTNPSFESPNVPATFAITGGAGGNTVWYLVDTVPTGWSMIDPSGGIRIIDGTNIEASSGLTPANMTGSQFVILGSGFIRGDGNGTGTDLFQNIGTTDGLSNVTLLIDTSGRGDSALVPADITIGIWQDTNANSIPDLALATLSVPAASETTALLSKSISALGVPGGTQLYVRFTAANSTPDTFKQTLIDNVRILTVAVPEPSSVLLLGFAAIAMGAFRRRLRD